MTRKERFLTALRVQQPDRVPLFDFLFQKPMYEALIGHQPDGYNGRDAVACALALNHDGVWLPFGGFSGFQPRYLEKNVYVDEWGTTYETSESSWPIDAPVDYPIKSRDDLKHYRPPDPTLPGRDAQIVEAQQIDTDNLALLGGVAGPLTTTWLLMGYETIALALYDDPELLTECFRMSNEYNKEAARRSVAAGCHGMWMSEDLGDSHQGFMSTEHFRRYLLPFVAELAEYITNLKPPRSGIASDSVGGGTESRSAPADGVPVLLHSCGCINQYLDDLAQTKIASVHPLQRTAKMDLRAVKEKYGKRFCLIGNIDSSRTLPYGTPAEVAAEVRAAIDAAAPGGGYVLASDHSLHDGIPIDNIREMFRVGTEHGTRIYAS